MARSQDTELDGVDQRWQPGPMQSGRRVQSPSMMTIKAVAGLLGVSEPTLRRWDIVGKFPARRHPINGYRLYERAQVMALQARMQRPRLVDVPHDFPNFRGDRDLAIVDTLIVMLFGDRQLLGDLTWRQTALARVERARGAIIAFGEAPRSRAVRLELLVTALDRSAELDAPLDSRVQFVRIVIEEAMPNAQLKDEVVRDAVRLWPAKRQTDERSRAVRALARALQCDAPSLMTMLRASRKKIRDRAVAARRT